MIDTLNDFFKKKPDLDKLCKMIREEESDIERVKLKRLLPSLTIGVKDSGEISNYMSFDIDYIFTDNEVRNLSIMENLKELFSEIPYIIYAQRSITKGLFIICKIDYESQLYNIDKPSPDYQDYFKMYMKIYYKLWLEFQLKWDLQIDFLPNLDRKRFYSDQSVIFSRTKEEVVNTKGYDDYFRGEIVARYIDSKPSKKGISIVKFDTKNGHYSSSQSGSELLEDSDTLPL